MGTTVTLDDTAARAALLGDVGRELVDAVIDDAGGKTTAVRTQHVSLQPGRSLVVRFGVDVRWGDGVDDTTESLVLAAGDVARQGALLVEGPFGTVAAWRHPDDPGLPGLRAAVDPSRVRSLLDDLGHPAGAVTLRERAYRPGRRAVIEAWTPSGRLFLKVVRPAAAAKLQGHHARLAPVMPVPPSHGWSESLGIVALGPLDGPTARESLRSGGPGVSGGTILALLDRLTAAPGEHHRRPSPTSDAAHHARSVAAVLPSESSRLDRLVASLGDDAPQAEVAVHGDLHPAQLITDRGRLTGLLDLDTIAIGQRVDDLATYTGHLATIALTSRHRSTIEAHGADLLRAFDQAVDPVELRRRTAAVVVGLATGPYRVQERGWQAATRARIALAERWLASARRLARPEPIGT